MTGYAIIIEGEDDSFSAYAPELPGCVATGHSLAEVEAQMREAIGFHLEIALSGGGDEPLPAGKLRRAVGEPVVATRRRIAAHRQQ